MDVKKYQILANQILVCNYKYLFEQIIKRKRNKKSLLICPVATYALVKAYQNPRLKNVLDKFYLVVDSEWVKTSIKFLYGDINVIKMRATDLMLNTMSFVQRNKFKIFLYGTNKKTLNKLLLKLIYKYPDLKIVGAVSSTYKKISKKEKVEIIKEIDNSQADILFVGIGSPLQEVFSEKLLNEAPKLKKNIIIITVGAAFDFISGVKPQAPRFLQKLGFEWLFRLFYEPYRLWKRYLFYGPLFTYLVFKQKLNKFNSN